MDKSSKVSAVKSDGWTSGYETLIASDRDHFRRWDFLVDQSPTPDVYYRPGYALANEAAGLGIGIAAVLRTRRQRFLVSFLKRALPEFSGARNITGFDAATPYGYGGVLPLDLAYPDDEEIQELLDALKSWCLQEGIVSCYLRLHPMMDQMRWVEGIKQRADSHVMTHCPTIAMDLSQWDPLNNCISSMKRRRRKDMNRARRELKATWSTTGVEQFQELYAHEMDRLHAEAYCRFPPEYYQVLTSRLPGKWHILSVHRRECLVGIALYLFDALYLHGHLIAITDEGRACGASTFIYNEGAAWARRNGLKGFHVGGGRSYCDPLYEFKDSFGGIRCPYSSVGLIADHDAYVRLCKLRAEQADLDAPRDDFFPFYRG